MKTELNKYTKYQLQVIATKLFNIKLSKNKSDYINTLNNYFTRHGDNKYNDKLITLCFIGNLKPYTDIIEDDAILYLNYLKPYDKFLYKYLLGFKKLYEDNKDKVKKTYVDYNSTLFNNQFNTLDNKRFLEFDNFIIPSIGYKKLQNTRNNTYICSYCGKQYDENTNDGYCTSCRGSEFLTEDNYHLLKLIKLSCKHPIKHEIPKTIKDDILHKQTITAKIKYKKQLIYDKKSLEKKINSLKLELKIKEYLLNTEDLIILLSDYIFYNHSNTLVFGWQNKLIDNKLKIALKYKNEISRRFNITVEVK